MVTKTCCDVCGAEIPSMVGVPRDEAINMYSGTFSYGAIVCVEFDDLCEKCGAKIRDFVIKLKKEKETKRNE